MKHLICLAAAMLGFSALAQVPSAIAYQGLLADENGNPLVGTVDLTFRLYTEATNGSIVWTDNLSAVPVTDGVFGVLLGPGGTPPMDEVAFDAPLYLGIAVNLEPEMEPRVLIASVPFALRATVSDRVASPTIGGLSCAAGQVATWNGTGWECGDFQRLVSGSCAVGSAIRAINADGSVVCEPGGTGTCLPGMMAIDGFCIDRWEAYLAGWSPYEVPTGGTAASGHGAVPQGYISGDVAATACAAAGKRLCTSQEWLRACQGPVGTTYPYGNTYDPEACNEGRDVHPIVELFGPDANWSGEQMNDPRLNQLPNSLDPAGANPNCVSAEGVYDLHGNLHEWVADPDGTFRGGYYVDASINGAGCLYATTAHTLYHHDFSTGFRCCADPR